MQSDNKNENVRSEDTDGEHPSPEVMPHKKRWFVRRPIVIGGMAALIAAGGIIWILLPPESETTDNAYVQADSTSVAPKVSGLVAEILVTDNQIVHAGDPLLKIDAEEYSSRVDMATAALADAEAGVASSRASLLSLSSEISLAQASVKASESQTQSARAQAGQATSDRRRYEQLRTTGAVAVRDVDTYNTAAITAELAASRFVALSQVEQKNLEVIQAKRPVLEAALQKAEAETSRARADLKIALQNERHTVIYAPMTGRVGNKQVQKGDYLQPGSRVMTLVPLRDFYITANFKETQTGRMNPGQKVKVSIDALPDMVFSGTVESLAPGSGSNFALLPFEPGTGNFTRIVQRVPVRIKFDPDANITKLRAGLSAKVRVSL